MNCFQANNCHQVLSIDVCVSRTCTLSNLYRPFWRTRPQGRNHHLFRICHSIIATSSIYFTLFDPFAVCVSSTCTLFKLEPNEKRRRGAKKTKNDDDHFEVKRVLGAKRGGRKASSVVFAYSAAVAVPSSFFSLRFHHSHPSSFSPHFFLLFYRKNSIFLLLTTRIGHSTTSSFFEKVTTNEEYSQALRDRKTHKDVRVTVDLSILRVPRIKITAKYSLS